MVAKPWSELAARTQFANPWHDDMGRFAPKGVGRQVHSIARSIRNAGERAMADDVDDIAHRIESGRIDEEGAIIALEHLSRQLDQMDIGDPSVSSAYDDVQWLLGLAPDVSARKHRMTNGSTAEFGNPWHDEIGRFAPKGSGTKSSEGPDWHNRGESDTPPGVKPDWHNRGESDSPRRNPTATEAEPDSERAGRKGAPITADNDWHNQARSDIQDIIAKVDVADPSEVKSLGLKLKEVVTKWVDGIMEQGSAAGPAPVLNPDALAGKKKRKS